jgi:hypothetical protein
MNYPCYMDRPEETAKYAAICRANGCPVPENGARSLCEAMAAGDPDVFDVIWKIWNFENAFDDLIDETGIDGDTKIVAIAALHDVVIAVNDMDLMRNFLAAWRFLEVRTRWSKQRRILAATARNQFFGMLHLNPFARAHAQQLRAMLVQTMLRCISGDVMAKSGDARKIALAPAVRCGDVDLFMHIIYLARGFGAASVWCGKLGYDLPDQVLADGHQATKEKV